MGLDQKPFNGEPQDEPAGTEAERCTHLATALAEDWMRAAVEKLKGEEHSNHVVTAAIAILIARAMEAQDNPVATFGGVISLASRLIAKSIKFGVIKP